MSYQDTKCVYFWEYLVPFTRFWGIFTAVVMCGVGVDITFHHHVMGIYVMIAAFIVLVLEVTWAVSLFLQVCLRNEHSWVFCCWDVVLWIDRWRKSIIYAGFSIALFIRPHRLWLSFVAGVMLVLLAALYILHTCRARLQAKDTLLQNRDDSYDRFDDLPEAVDDSLPGPIHDSLSDSLVEQDAVLEM